MARVIPSLVSGWLAFWIVLWQERSGSYARFSVDDLPVPIIIATAVGLASWVVIAGWPRTRARFARHRALRENRATEPKRWQRLVGWCLVFGGVSEAFRTLTVPLSLTEIFLTCLWFWLGTWWIVSNPPPDGYLIVRMWDAVRSAVDRHA